MEIDLSKIRYNAQHLKESLNEKGVSIIGITKVVLGDPKIAKSIIAAGIKYIGDSRVQNIKKLYKVGIKAKLILIRNPSLSEIQEAVQYADISLNSELEVIKALSREAIKQNKTHGIILMIEMGDLREGILPEKIEIFLKRILDLKGIKLIGIGTNLKCFAGVIPDQQNMEKFSRLALKIQNKFNITLELISGGNSANYRWIKSTNDTAMINNLRLGTAIIMGAESIEDSPIHELKQNAITLGAEIIQLNEKPKNPTGNFTTNAFGEPSIFNNPELRGEGSRRQALLDIGRQDIEETGLTPEKDITIMGASSDYLICDIKDNNFRVGDTLKFKMNYEAILRAMTSPYVKKKYIEK